jgi:hypothetical protein
MGESPNPALRHVKSKMCPEQDWGAPPAPRESGLTLLALALPLATAVLLEPPYSPTGLDTYLRRARRHAASV